MRDHLELDTPELKQLVTDLKGKHARRMNEMLEDLPDKQFRIVYPKLLEFLFPKPQRLELPKAAGEDNSVLRIEIISSPEQLVEAPPIIDITPESTSE